MNLLTYIYVAYKRLRSKRKLVPAFCKMCGRDVHDFVAPDEIWERVTAETGRHMPRAWPAVCVAS